MGAFCSCFHVSDNQNNASSSRDCSCPKCFFKRLMNKRTNRSNRGETRVVSLANSSNFQLVVDNSSYANESNVTSVANNAISERQEKGTSRSRVQPEPNKRTFDQEKSELLLHEHKEVVASVNDSSFSDDEDVCPTCLEEYTLENPKIVAKCTHHYHLSCIYEWMEQSATCPACGALMLFDESKQGLEDNNVQS